MGIDNLVNLSCQNFLFPFKVFYGFQCILKKTIDKNLFYALIFVNSLYTLYLSIFFASEKEMHNFQRLRKFCFSQIWKHKYSAFLGILT